MVLIYDRMMRDPRIVRLSAEAFRGWITGIRLCSRLERDVVRLDELYDAIDEEIDNGRDYDLEAILYECGDEDLIERMDDGRIRFRARLDLWAFEEEVPPKHITESI